MNEIRSKLSADLKNALKEGNTLAVKTIRSLMSTIDNASAVVVEKPEIMPMSGEIAGATSGLGSTEVARRELSVDDVKKIVQKEIDEINKAIISINNDSLPEVVQLKKQMELLKKYS